MDQLSQHSAEIEAFDTKSPTTAVDFCVET